ncbi:MAG: hypothetical protein KH376_11725, partial [Holdemanella biformis]|uniref:hypothetical protein n=1 Tax=Holdemanella biformis TaxID=1735 RepID=UPI0024320B96
MKDCLNKKRWQYCHVEGDEMSENPNTKNQRDKTIFELINDLRKDEKVYLRFLVVSMILECLI